MSRGNGRALALATAALTAAVVTELRRAQGDRTWHGSLLGLVP